MSERVVCSHYEDACTAELKEIHACFTGGKAIKTSAEDAVQDLKIFEMIYEQWERQQGNRSIYFYPMITAAYSDTLP